MTTNRKELGKLTCEFLRLRLGVKQGGPGRAPLYKHLRDPSSKPESERENVPGATPGSENSNANLRARVQQPSQTSRPNLPRILRWNPDADANERRTGSKDVVDRLALPRVLHLTLAALPPPAWTVRTTAGASACHDGTEKAPVSDRGMAAPLEKVSPRTFIDS